MDQLITRVYSDLLAKLLLRTFFVMYRENFLSSKTDSRFRLLGRGDFSQRRMCLRFIAEHKLLGV